MAHKVVDLHTHSNLSDDGMIPREEILRRAQEHNVSAIAFTEHDVIDWDDDADRKTEAARIGIEVVPYCVEITVADSAVCTDMHVLGFICEQTDSLDKVLAKNQSEQERRGKAMFTKAEQIGLVLPDYDATRKKQGRPIGRPVVEQLLREYNPDRFTEKTNVWKECLRMNSPLSIYEGKTGEVDAQEAVDVLREARAVIVLAHPGRYTQWIERSEEGSQLVVDAVAQARIRGTREDNIMYQMERVLEHALELGLDGLEAPYPYHGHSTHRYSPKFEDRINSRVRSFSRSHELLRSSGSDEHGEVSGVNRVGTNRGAYILLERIKERKSVWTGKSSIYE